MQATSALDNESERVVQAALDELVATGNRTTVIVAHRLSTIRSADKIVVFRNDGFGGEIAEQGTHNDLLRIKGGVYKHLHSVQEQTEE